tara:strand:+ start:4752 stop:5537 length:786 start_codon:yes stop_codon:yes gene_type:complete
MESLLNKANKTHLIKEPFPHIIIEDALDLSFYEELSSNFPIDFFYKNSSPSENNIRKDLLHKDLILRDDIDKLWVDFVNYHSSNVFFREIINIFKNEIIQYYPSKFSNINEILDTESKNQLSTCVNTQVLEYSSVRGAHLDNMNKLFTGLFYLKHKDDFSTGGDLELFSWKKNISVNKKRLSINDIKMEDINFEKTIKYKPNTFLIFLNSLNSLHGVTPRSVTKSFRRMCVFTSKLPFSLDNPNILDRIKIKIGKYSNHFV